MRFQLYSQMQHAAGEKKLANKIQASYTLEGTVLEKVESIKYLGVTITNDLKRNTHISNVCTKANITLAIFFLSPTRERSSLQGSSASSFEVWKRGLRSSLCGSKRCKTVQLA